MATLADAIHFAHQRGVVHRDLKPANVLLGGGAVSSKQEITHHSPAATQCALATPQAPFSTHQVKITDFGLAKRLEAQEGETEPGQVMGSPRYMAPEQAQGRIQEVGPAADVYALGAILYECLTGRPPFREETFALTAHKVLTEDPVPPRHCMDEMDLVATGNE